MKKIFCITAILMGTLLFSACESEELVPSDATAPARVIFNQVRSTLATPAYVVSLAERFNEYYLAATEEERIEIEDRYFSEYKIRERSENIWSLERNNNVFVKIVIKDGKALSEVGAEWSLLHNEANIDGHGSFKIVNSGEGLYTISMNTIPSYGLYDSSIVLSGTIKMSTSGSMGYHFGGSYRFYSDSTPYTVTVTFGSDGDEVFATPARGDLDDLHSMWSEHCELISGKMDVRVEYADQTETISFVSSRDYAFSISYTTAEGDHYQGWCNSLGQKYEIYTGN